MFRSNAKLRADVRVVPLLPTLGVSTRSFPTSAVTFILPSARLHAHLCIEPTNDGCEQTADIKLRGKYGSFCVSYPDYSWEGAFDICFSATKKQIYSLLTFGGEPMSEFHIFVNNSLSTEHFKTIICQMLFLHF